MASMREREKVVQTSLAESLRDRDREREQHLKDEAIQHFNALMADMVISSCFLLISTQHPACIASVIQKEVHLTLLWGPFVNLLYFLTLLFMSYYLCVSGECLLSLC